ncbi:MAG: methylated-DNA--[protein]-cysteine S-methyltransferase [Christensenellaceae bacterium]|nr:methylated-DNA--[protein]-cysteine S-methyltransferase [Christensenellaceae bacterium]
MQIDTYNTPIGFIELSHNNNVLYRLNFVSKDNGSKSDFGNMVYKQLCEYFNGERKYFEIAYELIGTSFQKNVWNALLKISYGQTRSYKDIAIDIASPKAFRAVGMANNKNPIPIIVPCHRVIGSDGGLVGYGGGLDIKIKLLQLEGVAI